MNDKIKLLIIIILIVIILILLLNNNNKILSKDGYIEHLTETNDNKTTLDALNNITNLINNDTIKSKKLEITDKGIINNIENKNIDTNKINTNDININNINIKEYIMNLIYPIGSLYLSSYKYCPYDNSTLQLIRNNTQFNNNSNKDSYKFYNFYGIKDSNDNNYDKLTKNTMKIDENNPLNYGTWIILNYVGFNSNLGIHKLQNEGNDKFDGWRYIKNTMLNNDIYTYQWHKNSSLALSPNCDANKPYQSARDFFTPAGYYCYVYKKISNKKSDQQALLKELELLNIKFKDEPNNWKWSFEPSYTDNKINWN